MKTKINSGSKALVPAENLWAIAYLPVKGDGGQKRGKCPGYEDCQGWVPPCENCDPVILLCLKRTDPRDSSKLRLNFHWVGRA